VNSCLLPAGANCLLWSKFTDIRCASWRSDSFPLPRS